MPTQNHPVERAPVPRAARTARPSRLFTGWLFSALLLCAAAGFAHAKVTSGTCRVTTAGLPANSGASWSAPKSLMSALIDYGCTEIWVAEGVYVADSYPFQFRIRANAQVYGGFAGNESSRSQRDPAAHVTILSGDKDHNDTNLDGNFIAEDVDDIQGTNNRQLVYFNGSTNAITPAVVLDGFTVTAGDGRPVTGSFGGALYCYGGAPGSVCSPTLRNLIFIGNTATFGGAVCLGGGSGGEASPVLDHVSFINNEAAKSGGGQAYGGGLYCDGRGGGTCSPTLTHVIFRDNYAGYYGGGMFNDAQGGGLSSPSLVDVSFEDNNAFYLAGGMMNFGFGGESSPSLLNVTFANNSAASGGGMANTGVPNAVEDFEGLSEPTLRNVTFSGNHANGRGGAIYNNAAQGGVVNLTITNVTFRSNHGGTDGGAIFSDARTNGFASLTLKNVILWDNTANNGHAIFFDDTENATTDLAIDYSIVEGGDAGIAYETGAPHSEWATGSSNASGDPMLSALGNHGGFTKTMLPGVTGTAVDNGSCVGVPPTDQRGVSRIGTGAGCDIGSVEAQSDSIFQSGFE